MEDTRSRQNANPTALNPPFSIILNMKIPDEPQKADAKITRNIPVILLIRGEEFVSNFGIFILGSEFHPFNVEVIEMSILV